MSDGVICPKSRLHCYSADDYKLICPNCGNRSFISNDSIKSYERHWGEKVKGIWVECRKCLKSTEYDITEKKSWYGEYDGKVEIYDLFYCGDYEIDSDKLINELRLIYPGSYIEKSYDIVHGNRVTFSVRENRKEYYKNILKLGYFNISFSVNLVIDGVRMGMQLNEENAEDLLGALKENNC